MTGNVKEAVAKARARLVESLSPACSNVRERIAPIAGMTCGRLRECVGSVVRYSDSVVTRMSVRERLTVLFVIGLALGFGVKSIAGGFMTIGYQDYSVKGSRAAYDLNELQRAVAERNAAAAVTGEESASPSQPQGDACR